MNCGESARSVIGDSLLAGCRVDAELGFDAVQSGFELFYGVEAAGAGEQRRVRNALMGYPIVPADDRIARLAGRLHARHRTAGVDLGDCYVGATARVYDEPVLTRNADDFAALGVEVESY